VVEAVPGRVGGDVGQPEGPGEVDDARAVREQLRRQLGRDLGRRGEEDQLRVRLVPLGERAVGQPLQLAPERQPVACALGGPPIGEQGGDPDLRVARQDPGELEAGVAGGANDGDCMLQNRPLASRIRRMKKPAREAPA
jgi:hypothetical protein